MITRMAVRAHGRLKGWFARRRRLRHLPTACDSVPLLAPSGTTITLTASTNAIPANGTAQLVAYSLEQAGTPPHPGTQVIFTTRPGVVEPGGSAYRCQRARDGRLSGPTDKTVTPRLTPRPGGATAAGGGAGDTPRGTTGAREQPSTGPVRISVGTAAVGHRVDPGNPTTISANGGSASVTANVVDVNGNTLPGAPVSFATSAGVLSGSLVNTDSTETSERR